VSRVKNFSLCLVIVLLTGRTRAALAGPETVTLTILHTNDLSGDLRGAAGRAALIRRALAGGRAIALDAGNGLSPDPLSAHDRGATMVEAMSRTGYAAAAVGGRDFDFGADTLRVRAAEARFPFLSANVLDAATGRLLFRPCATFTVGGVRVGVAGLTPAEAVRLTTAERLKGVKVSDPFAAARSAVRDLREGGADYVILLTSMREADALDLARSAEGADLVVAGDYHRPSEARATVGMAWLMGGARVVSTPKQGDYVGRLEVAFAREGAGWRAGDVRWGALAVEGAPQDTGVARLVEGRAAAFERAMKGVVGRVEAGTGEEVGQVLAGVARRRGGGEIGVVNRGALEAVFQEGFRRGVWTRLDVAQTVRFDGHLVAVTLRGDRVRSLFQRGQGLRGQPGELFFSGVERRGGGVLVNGRPLMDGEDYRVVTSDFLAGGGDGHAEFRSGRRRSDLSAGIRQSLIDYLMANWSASPEDFRGERGTRIWQGSWAMTGSFVRNFINDAVDRYRTQGERAAFLSGVTAVAWSGKMSAGAGYEVGRSVARIETRLDFGQVGRGLRDLAKSSDQIDVAATYRYRTGGIVDPLLSAGLLTAFTPQAGAGGRPFQVRGNIGFQRQVAGGLVARFSGRGQRDLSSKANDVGTEVGVEYRRRLKSGVTYSGRVRTFLGLTDRRVTSFENYNVLSVPLVGLLHLTVQGNLYTYRADYIQGKATQGTAFRSDLNVGLTYGVNWKWY